MKIILKTEENREFSIRVLRELDISKEPEFSITKKKKRKRTSDQNALYWKWLDALSQQTFSTKDELHEACKRRFALPIMLRETDDYPEFAKTWAMVSAVKSKGLEDGVIFLVSTTMMKVKHFSEYMTDIERHYVGLGFRLPAVERDYR